MARNERPHACHLCGRGCLRGRQIVCAKCQKAAQAANAAAGQHTRDSRPLPGWLPEGSRRQ